MGFIRLKTFLSVLSTVLFLVPALTAQTRGPWQTEVVDTGRDNEISLLSLLVIDHNGNFHIAFSNHNGTALRYAFRAKSEKRWDTMTVDSTGGRFSSLAVDAHGWAHIAYNTANMSGLHYAFWDGKQWQKFLIDGAKTNNQTSIQLDDEGHPRISYFREEYEDRRFAKYLKYAYFEGNTWYVQTVDHRLGTGRWNSLDLDGNGRPYISYSIGTSGNLGIAFLNQSDWERSLADSHNAKIKSSADSANSLAIGGDGEPRIAYLDAAARILHYVWRQSDGWHQEDIDSLVSTGSDSDRVSLKIDHSSRPHVVYYDSGAGVVKYATRDEQGWHTEIVEKNGAGAYASLCLDANDQPFVAYYAPAERELRIARRAPVDPVSK